MVGMAFFHMNFFSPTLLVGTDVNVFIPTPDSGELSTGQDIGYFHDGVKYPVLYLLHGAYGDYSDWARLTGIERYAQAHKIAVVMPSADNSFYQDMYRGGKYLTYFTRELPDYIARLFPVSTKREDTFVAGLSMGGYGAVRVAFEMPERFGAAASLSGAIDLLAALGDAEKEPHRPPFYWDAIFADPGKVEGSDADLFALAQKRLAEGRKLPPIYQTVGTEDLIYPANLSAKKKLEELGLELTYAEHPGIHDWEFWDAHIRDVLDWLPIRSVSASGQ
jgi:putative tributyrin esterase